MTFQYAEVPLPPDVTINNTTLICYNSAKSMNAQSLFFEIVIYDVTSEIVFEEQSQNSTYCADVNDLLNDNLCSPYTVTVRAYNLYISSNTTIMFSNGTGSGIYVMRKKFKLEYNSLLMLCIHLCYFFLLGLNVCGCVAQNRGM